MNQFDHACMAKTLILAEKGRLTVSPNPMVGCIIVKGKKIIGSGWHQQAGSAHAELIALEEAGKHAKNATLYVTLEPCSHQGRTGPCVKAIIAAGIKRVVIATKDPNPKVNGNGISQLKADGVCVDVGCCEEESVRLNKIFFHYHQHHRPYVMTKWAMSLDGKTMTHPNDSRHITDQNTQLHAHNLRNQVDAILIGANTARKDNPTLNVRRKDLATIKQPMPIVISLLGNVPLTLKLLHQNRSALIVTSKLAPDAFVKALEKNGHDVLVVSHNDLGEIDLTQLLSALADKGITSLLLEGGEHTRNAFLRSGLIDEVQVYIAPVVIGTLNKKRNINNLSIEKINDDYLLKGDMCV